MPGISHCDKASAAIMFMAIRCLRQGMSKAMRHHLPGMFKAILSPLPRFHEEPSGDSRAKITATEAQTNACVSPQGRPVATPNAVQGGSSCSSALGGASEELLPDRQGNLPQAFRYPMHVPGTYGPMSRSAYGASHRPRPSSPQRYSTRSARNAFPSRCGQSFPARRGARKLTGGFARRLGRYSLRRPGTSLRSWRAGTP
jgi:hypothetical protein